MGGCLIDRRGLFLLGGGLYIAKMMVSFRRENKEKMRFGEN